MPGKMAEGLISHNKRNFQISKWAVPLQLEFVDDYRTLFVTIKRSLHTFTLFTNDKLSCIRPLTHNRVIKHHRYRYITNNTL